MNKTSPDLNIRYAKGLGDVVACFLHSKPIGWLTHAITGNDKPCTICSNRRTALNVLVPFDLWKLFFNTEKDYLKDLSKSYKEAGHKVDLNLEKNILTTSKAIVVPTDEEKEKKETISAADKRIEDYRLISTSDSKQENLLIRLQIYKLKD
jgi:hypothetical protein